MRSFFVVLAVLLFLTTVIDARKRKVQKRQFSFDGIVGNFAVDITAGNSANSPVAQAALAAKRAARAEKQRQQVLKLYNNVIYPTSSQIAYQIERNNYSVVADYLLQNVTGRINPLGRFDTYFLTGEYFYSLAGPLPGMPTAGRGRVTNIWFTNPITCWNNSCWFRVDIGMSSFDTNINTGNFTHIGVMNFDTSDRICAYEVNFVGISRTNDLPENPAIRQGAINSLCMGIISRCTGGNIQYDGNVTTCQNFMNSIPYGGWGQADQNTQVCRQLHMALVPGNPSLHCPHVGATGGGKCIFHPNSSYYEDNLDQCRDKSF